MRTSAFGGLLALGLVACSAQAIAQAPRFRTPDPYPQRPVDAASVERGRALYVNNGCAFCHGKDIRGGDGGPSLQRSSVVLLDVRGEKIGPVVRAGVPGGGMPAFPQFTDAQMADLADFLHSFAVRNGGAAARPPPSIVVGDPAAGRAYFHTTCAGCHSATGDLAGFATRVPDPRTLQQRWLAPNPTRPGVAVVSMPDGSTLTGTPTRIDEFTLSLKLADGTERVIARDGDRPRIVMQHPLQPHIALLRTYSDKNIHDVTAYLVTLK